jgi:hypothetical protein
MQRLRSAPTFSAYIQRQYRGSLVLQLTADYRGTSAAHADSRLTRNFAWPAIYLDSQSVALVSTSGQSCPVAWRGVGRGRVLGGRRRETPQRCPGPQHFLLITSSRPARGGRRRSWEIIYILCSGGPIAACRSSFSKQSVSIHPSFRRTCGLTYNDHCSIEESALA